MNILPFSGAQAGGQQGKGPPDQLFTLYEILRQRKAEKKPTFVAFLDVHKAYDKAWRGIILHILWEANIRGKLWRLLHHLNTDITAQILTRFGLTRIINVKGGVKQGGVLSVGQFSKMIDELNGTLLDADVGVKFHDLCIPSLMFVDDIILLAESAEDLQKALDTTYNFFCKNHLRISQNKSNIIVFNCTTRTHKQTWTFGAKVLEEVSQYKYLGHIISPNLSFNDDLKHKRSLVEAALGTCMAVASDEVLHHIRVDTLLQLYNTCIVPIILYGTEVWTHTRLDTLEQLQHKCLKRLMKLPTSTPNAATLIETGILPIKVLVHRKQLNFHHKLKNAPESLAGRVLNQQENAQPEPVSWTTHIQETLSLYNLQANQELSNDQWKWTIRKPSQLVGSADVYSAATTLSKLSRLVESKPEMKREEYLAGLPHYHARLVFKARCRMLNFKNNFRNGKASILCELCEEETEDDDHVIDRCTALQALRSEGGYRRDELFDPRTTVGRLSELANFLVQIEKKLRKL